MAQRNPAREIAFSLIAAVVLGGGMYIYLKSTIPDEEDLRANMTMTAPSAERPEASLSERAGSLVQRFITALREKRFRDAHALTVRSYQNAVTVAEFQATIEAAPYLATAKEISFVRVSQQSMVKDGQSVTGPVLGRGMLISDKGTADVSVTLSPEEDTLHVFTITAAGIPLFNAMALPQ
ncbi:MAG TPA: hypothetical protein VHO25_11160 [Polyangiaceae bacterium]|nr:hypothetical protein [Polyangiaceae bacterium]